MLREVCQLAKHKCISFAISNKRSLISFYLIYIDIWDLSTILNVFGVLWFVLFINDCTCVI